MSTSCSSFGLPCVGVRLVTPIYGYIVIFFHWSVVDLFSPLFFLLCLFQISLHTLLSRGLPSFLQPSCFFLSDLFRNLSSFIQTMYIHTYGRIKCSLLLHISQ